MFNGKFWHMREKDVEGLLFRGAPELLRLIDYLYRRPSQLWSEKFLPIVFLTVPPGETSPLVGIEKRLSDPRSGPVQYASIGAGSPQVKTSLDPRSRQSSATVRTASTVDELLGDAVAQLGTKYHRRRRLKFPHYALATWLLHLKIQSQNGSKYAARDKEVDDTTGRLKNLMKEYRFSPIMAANVGDKLPVGAPWWVIVATHLLPKLALQLMWLTWRPRRWLARNPLLQMTSNRSLHNVARWFLSDDRAVESRRDVKQLLVGAFLEDLRRAYRRTSILGVGRRRTGYPVLLVDALSDGGGEMSLLELIDDVRIIASARLRRGQGRHIAKDPLLVVAAGKQLITSTRRSQPPADARPAYLDWKGDLLTAGRDLTWFLDFEIPYEGAPSITREQLGEDPPHRLRRPWMSYAASIAVLSALTSALVALPLTNPSRCQSRSSLSLTSSLKRVPLKNGLDQCIGLSDNIDPFDARLADVWARIKESNAKAMADPHHLTVAYFGMLTTQNEDSYRFVREELKGIAVAQRSMLSTVPVRIVLANAGDGMTYAPDVAQWIAERTRSDSTGSDIAAVMGMGISNNKAREAIITLEHAGLAIVGTETSADAMSETSPNYYQVGPNNLREATVVANYAKTKLRARKARIYYSGDPQDIYSKNLADDVRNKLSENGILVRESRGYRTPGNPLDPQASTLGGQACQAEKDEIVFYAGRAEDLPAFAQGIAQRCPGRTPRILAGDDMSRLFLGEGRRVIPGVPMDYMAFASSAGWGTDCILANNVIDLYNRYEEMFSSACQNMLDGNAIIAYDTFLVVTRAIEILHGYRPDVDIHSKLLDGIAAITADRNLLVGASGEIDYGDPMAPQVPADKTVMVLRASANSPCVIDIDGRSTTQMRPTVACAAE